MKRGPTASTFTEQVYSERTDETLSVQSKTYRDAFCREYIKDFCSSKALARIGCTYKNLTARGSQLLREPYVANRIDQLVRQLQVADVVQRQQVMARMWQLANDEKAASVAQVAACAHVGKMLGMFKEEKAETENTIPIGVMMIPVLSVDDWQATATTAQAVLKRQANGSADVYPPPPPPIPATIPVHGTS